MGSSCPSLSKRVLSKVVPGRFCGANIGFFDLPEWKSDKKRMETAHGDF
jgi:hypothetical protein